MQLPKAQLLWCDMEMTGLDPERDLALEIAVIATDWDFNEIAEFSSGIGQDVSTVGVLLDANNFYKKYPENRKALLELTDKSPSETIVEKQLQEFVKKHFDLGKPVILAGNSIHQDRRFIRRRMPFFDQLLHYRMLDVTAWKVVFEGKYGAKYDKKEAHRALDDVRESIGELQFYMGKIGNGNS